MGSPELRIRWRRMLSTGIFQGILQDYSTGKISVVYALWVCMPHCFTQQTTQQTIWIHDKHTTQWGAIILTISHLIICVCRTTYVCIDGTAPPHLRYVVLSLLGLEHDPPVIVHSRSIASQPCKAGIKYIHHMIERLLKRLCRVNNFWCNMRSTNSSWWDWLDW